MEKTIKIINELRKRKMIRAKAAYHKYLARLPFKKKIEILVKLQNIAYAAKPPGNRIKPWKLD